MINALVQKVDGSSLTDGFVSEVVASMLFLTTFCTDRSVEWELGRVAAIIHCWRSL